MRQFFRSGDFTESQKVSYATLKLDGEALQWWEDLYYFVPEATLHSMTCDAFN